MQFSLTMFFQNMGVESRCSEVNIHIHDNTAIITKGSQSLGRMQGTGGIGVPALWDHQNISLF